MDPVAAATPETAEAGVPLKEAPQTQADSTGSGVAGSSSGAGEPCTSASHDRTDEAASPEAGAAEEADDDADAAEPAHDDVDLAPPDDCVAVTPDRGVLKHLLREGYGEAPPQFARALVHYVGRLADGGSVFMDTRQDSSTQQPASVVAGRSSQPRESGLSLAVATMKVGEKAAIYIQDPKYGFGQLGSFSFPAVPRNARLVYDVEMVQWEEPSPDEGDSRTGLLYEERLERAEKRRVQGNTLFSEGKHREAMGKYALALSYLDEDFLFQLDGMYLDKAHEVKLPVHLNMAACQLQLGDQHTAIYNCTEALSLDPGNTKALYRRGRAKHLLGQTEGAEEDLKAALKRAPEDGAIIKELHAVRSTVARERQAQAQLFKGTLAAAAATAAAPQEAPSAGDAPSGSEGAAGGSAPAEAGGQGGGAAAERDLRQAGAGGGGGGGGGSDGSLLQRLVAWLSWVLHALLQAFHRPKLHAH